MSRIAGNENFELCISLIAKHFEPLMFTQVVSPKESDSLSAIAETKATVNTYAFSACSCYSV